MRQFDQLKKDKEIIGTNSERTRGSSEENNNIEQLILDINKLLEKQNNDKNLFIENEIEPLIIGIFQQSANIVELHSKEIKTFLEKIICNRKSTRAYDLYRRIMESNFSFAEELLVYAIDHESYYNNNDHVFICYLLKTSHDTEINTEIKSFIEKTNISGGHFWGYKKKFSCAYELHKESLISSVPENMKEVIIHIIKKNEFYQTKMKAITTSLFLDIKESIPYIINMFKSEIDRFINMRKNEENFDYGIVVNSIPDLAFALYCFTNEEKYKELCIYPDDKMMEEKEKTKLTLDTIYQIVEKNNY